MNLIAYHNDQSVKDAILAQLARHREADELVKGHYWEDGKGCAVGCTIHSGNYAEYEPRLGIPQMLARLEDMIFEGLPNVDAKEWPERFMSAIVPGADLSRVGWHFLHSLLTDEIVNPGINHPLVKDTIKQCADALGLLTKGLPVDQGAVENAAWNAWNAAWNAESKRNLKGLQDLSFSSGLEKLYEKRIFDSQELIIKIKNQLIHHELSPYI